MSQPSDKRFKSFLWSQTHTAERAETRLTPPGPEAPPTGRAKGRLTPLEQATMRMSEFCAPPTAADVPNTAPGEQPQAPEASPAWQQLHVRAAVGTPTPLGRLNVRRG
jgi:hypothetical protein